MTTPTRPVYRSSPLPPAEEKPLAAVVLVVLGGLLIVLEGLLWAEYIVVFTGLFMFVMALLVRHEPHHHVANGVMVLVVVFMSLFFGYGGFYVGALLGAFGGILAVAWHPRILQSPVVVRQ